MSETEGHDGAWVSRLQAGEEQAWEEFVDRFGQRIWRVICRVGGFRPGQEDQVADIRQETFLAAVKSIRQYRGSARIETWLHRLAVHKTIDHIRKMGRRREESLEATDPETGEAVVAPAAVLNTPAEDLVQQERHAKLHECLETLRRQNERWWTIVMMHHFGDLLYKDVAQALAIPLGTVQGALHRARLLLAECLEGNKSAFCND